MIEKKENEYWMGLALKAAEQAGSRYEVPVGAVIIHENNLVATGFNSCITKNDASGHAEIECLREAGRVLDNYRLPNTTLYVTLEPCLMCAYALVHARVEKVVFGASDPKTGALGGAVDLFKIATVNHIYSVEGGVLEQECQTILQNFFKHRRK